MELKCKKIISVIFGSTHENVSFGGGQNVVIRDLKHLMLSTMIRPICIIRYDKSHLLVYHLFLKYERKERSNKQIFFNEEYSISLPKRSLGLPINGSSESPDRTY